MAQLLGIKKIYKVGGAQAIAAMAYGTQTVKKWIRFLAPEINMLPVQKN